MDNIFISRASTFHRLLTFHSKFKERLSISRRPRNNRLNNATKSFPSFLSTMISNLGSKVLSNALFNNYNYVVKLIPIRGEGEADWDRLENGMADIEMCPLDRPRRSIFHDLLNFSRIEFRWRGEFTFEVRVATESNYPFVCSLQPAVRRQRMKSVESISVLFAIEEKPITIVPTSRWLSDFPTVKWRSKMRSEKNVARE